MRKPYRKTHSHIPTMRRSMLLLVGWLLACMGVAEGSAKEAMVKFPGGKCVMYRLYLTDKRGTDYTLEHPSEFLSEKALRRRQRQGITPDSTDLPVSNAYLRQIEAAGLEVVSRSRWNNTVVAKARSQKAFRAVASMPFVRKSVKVFASPDSINKAIRSHYRTDFNSWDTLSANEYGTTEQQIKMLNGHRLHAMGYRGRGMTIAVLDGGFMNADVIPALKTISMMGNRDFVRPASADVFKEMDHGTKVLSAMAANVPNLYVGTATQASYWLLRCEDNSSENLVEEDYWAAAAEFADSAGVDIINSSLGFHAFDDKDADHSYADLDGERTLISHTASMLADKGIILVNSAGNEGMGTWKKINFPADARDIITVGAISPNGKNAAFSAIGPTADRRIKPDVMALGSPTAVITGRGTISRDMGTSFATPLITGLVACLWQALPQKTAREIIQAVIQSGDKQAAPDDIYGYGVPDFVKAYQLLKGK